MAKISLSGQEKSIEFILSWYEDQVQAVNDLEKKVIMSILYTGNKPNIDQKFVSLTVSEINSYFNNSKKELEHLVCLDVISATEAFLRVDYIKRVRKRERTKIGKLFRDVNAAKGNNVSLENDIIENWKSIRKSDSFSDFLGLLKYRHWLAHGRYWTPKLGQKFTFAITYKISKKVFQAVSK